MVDTHTEREQEFANQYEDFEAQDVVALVIATGNWLERLTLQPQAADAAMKCLYDAVIGAGPAQMDPAASWRELWSELPTSAEFELRTSQYFVALNAFGMWGLRPDIGSFGIDPDGGRITAAMEEFVRLGRALIDTIPPGWGSVTEMERAVLAAEARLLIDTDRDVRPEQLAALARVSLKSIKNLLTPKGGAPDLRLTATGDIRSQEALRWLKKRPDYKSSLWLDPDAGPAPFRKDFMAGDLGEVIFVPVAKDGSWFDPVRCRTGFGYQIGPKGAEVVIPEYRAALDHLHRMPTPYWRRPNEAGNFGLVAGVIWQRKRLSELAT